METFTAWILIVLLGSGGAYEVPHTYSSKERCHEAVSLAATSYVPEQGFVCIPVDGPSVKHEQDEFFDALDRALKKHFPAS